MITVDRSPNAPASIAKGSQREKKYSAELKAWEDNGKQGKPPSPPYRHDDVKLTLMDDFNKKCGYCEKKYARPILDIEHYRPKSVYPELAIDWNNFLLACRMCNMSKLDEFDENYPPINPCDDDPKNFFKYVKKEKGGRVWILITPKPGLSKDHEQRSLKTIELCELNNVDLLEFRAEAVVTAKESKEKHDSGEGGSYNRRYVNNQKEQEFLGALDFFGILP